MNVEEMFEKISSGEIKWIYCEKLKKYYRVTAEEITEEQYETEYESEYETTVPTMDIPKEHLIEKGETKYEKL